MDRNKFLDIIEKYKALGLDEQIDYEKFYLYSIITHSTAIEGSTMTETENRVLFDDGIVAKGKTLYEQNMNLDLKTAYERARELAKAHTPFSIGVLKHLSSLVMRRTGGEYNGLGGHFDASRGDLRLLNVTAGPGGRYYMNYQKVPEKLKELCTNINERREHLLEVPDIYEQYELSFDAHLDLVTIHPWADGNGRMSRLMMNYIQYEFGLMPANIMKEDRSEYIDSLQESRDRGSYTPFREFMMKIHYRNLKNEIENYNRDINDDFRLRGDEDNEQSRGRGRR